MARVKARRTNGAGSIRKLPSGRLQARFRGPDGALVSAPQTFEARVDAEAWLSAQRRDLSDGIWREPTKAANPVKAITLDAYFADWLAAKDDIRQGTRELYEGLWRRTIAPTIGSVALTRLTAERVKWDNVYSFCHSPAGTTCYPNPSPSNSELKNYDTPLLLFNPA